MKSQRVVLIGAGFFAQFQAEAWQRMADIDLVAVADPAPGKAQEFAATHGIARAYESVAAMLDAERPDIADIATRPDTHLALTQLVASRGVHVICQKPMAPTLADCVAMCSACESAGVRLLVHENWRWQPWYREAKRCLDRGDIGEPFQLSFFWRSGDGRGPTPYASQPYFREMPRLLIYESLVHLLDTFRFLGGECAVRHCSTARINPLIAGEDQAIIQLAFANEATGLIDGNRITGPVPAPVAMGTLLIEGTSGVLRVAPNGAIFLTGPGAIEGQLPFSPTETGYKGDSVFATQQHLIDCLRSGQPAESEGREYLKTVALVEDCYKIADKT